MIETEPDQSQLTRRYTQEAIKFIREHQAGSLFDGNILKGWKVAQGKEQR